MIKLTNLYKIILQNYKDINIAVDMTCGNGCDTLFLSELANKVYSFDIQTQAISKAKSLLKETSNVNFINDNHAHILRHIQEKVDVAIYNLGYLPGGDKSITTKAQSTIDSLKALLTILSDSGIIIIEVYPHNEKEDLEVSEFTLKLDNHYDVLKIDLHNKANSPYLIVIKKALK